MAWTNSIPADDGYKLNSDTNNSRSYLGGPTNYGRSSLGGGIPKAPVMSRDIDSSEFDRGSLIYILGNSSSSVWAKKIMSDIDKGNRRLKNINRNRNGGFR
jgi:hypothetical protein